MTESEKPESLITAELHRSEVVRNFLAHYQGGDLKVDMSVRPITKMPPDFFIVKNNQRSGTIETKELLLQSRDPRFQKFEELVQTWIGGTSATDTERLAAEIALYIMILQLRMGNRIDGKFEVTDSIREINNKIANMEKHLESIERWIRNNDPVRADENQYGSSDSE